MYNDIIHFLNDKRLNEALAQLTAFAEETDDWSLKSEIQNIKETYNYMLQYASQGMNDPERSKMYSSLIVKGYELADKTNMIHKSGKSNSEFSQAVSGRNSDLNVSYDSLTQIAELDDMNTQNQKYKEGIISRKEIQDIRERHEATIDNLFLKAWSSFHWSAQDYNDAELIVTSRFLTCNDIATFISGVTLGLLNMLDEKKFMLLISAYRNRQETIINQRALIGIVLIAYMHESRINLYPQLVSALQLLKDDTKCLGEIRNIQMLMLQTRETEKIDKKMREEILPQFMKNSKLMNPNFKIDNWEELDELNPEWDESLGKFSDKIKELGELQLEGADTYMGTFSQLKIYPFFKKAAHWFTPFYKEHTSVSDIFEQGKDREKSIVNILMESPTFCDSDKYSFCLTVNSAKGFGMDYLATQMNEEQDINKELKKYRPELYSSINICRQYIQDLYRFSKLWRYRDETIDIFNNKLALWKCSLLRPLIITDQTEREIADYLFSKGYMQEASELYESLVKENKLDANLMQKMGFSYQKQNLYDKAISAYQKADVLKPDHIWTMKQLAKCYKKTGEYDKALEYMEKIIAIQPDNLNILLQMGQCLAITERYDMAINYFYKVEYLGKTPENAQRPIGWCYFMTQQYDKAIEIYNKLISNTQPTMNDWLNLGHVYQAKGNIIEALECYRKVAQSCKTHDEFLKLYLADKKDLIKQGIEENNIYIMADMI